MKSALDGDLKKGDLPAAFYGGRNVQRLAGGSPFLDLVQLPCAAECDKCFRLDRCFWRLLS
jgi:hypothetical protein